MLEAGFWGAVGGVALVLGALIALRTPLSSRSVGLIKGFGTTAVGLAVGALTFFAGDTLIDSLAGRGGSTGASTGLGGDGSHFDNQSST